MTHPPPLKRNLFLNVQTTGLDFMHDHIIDIAWTGSHPQGGTQERQFFVHHDERLVSPWVRSHTDYDARIKRAPTRTSLPIVLKALAEDCYGPTLDAITYLVGSNIAFADRFLRVAYLNLFMREPPYHYRLIDLETVQMGRERAKFPTNMTMLNRELALAPPHAPYDALVKARAVRCAWEAMLLVHA